MSTDGTPIGYTPLRERDSSLKSNVVSMPRIRWSKPDSSGMLLAHSIPGLSIVAAPMVDGAVPRYSIFFDDKYYGEYEGSLSSVKRLVENIVEAAQHG